MWIYYLVTAAQGSQTQISWGLMDVLSGNGGGGGGGEGGEGAGRTPTAVLKKGQLKKNCKPSQ